jgi:uncharacterized membrane protein YeiH
MILRRGQIYATASIAGIIVYLTLQGIGVERTLAGLIGMAAIVGLRLAAIVWEITLPVFTVQDHDE